MPGKFPAPALAIAALMLAACATQAVTTEFPITVNGKQYTIFKTDYTSSVSDEITYRVVVNEQAIECHDPNHCIEFVRRITGAPRPNPPSQPTEPKPKTTEFVPSVVVPTFDGAD